MIASRSTRTLFVHVQKTGGKTVERLLLEQLPDAEPVQGLPGAKHARLRAALRGHPEMADYWTFGFVRNPWARMYSWWSMIMRREEAMRQGNAFVARKIDANSFWARVIEDYTDFERFVLAGPEEFPRLRMPQLSYLRTASKKADFIGRTESFDADVRRAFEQLGLEPPAEVPHRNAGPSEDWRERYTPAMRDRVATLFDADVRAFGYEF